MGELRQSSIQRSEEASALRARELESMNSMILEELKLLREVLESKNQALAAREREFDVLRTTLEAERLADVQRLEARCDLFERDLKARETEIDRLEGDKLSIIGEKDSEINSIEQMRSRSESKLRKTEDLLERLTAAHNELLDERRNMAIRVADVEAKDSESSTRIAELESELDLKGKQLKILNNRVTSVASRKDKQIAQLQEEVEANTAGTQPVTALSKIQETVKEQANRIEELEALLSQSKENGSQEAIELSSPTPEPPTKKTRKRSPRRKRR